MEKRDKNGKFINNAVLISRTCLVCSLNFNIKQSSLKYGRGKYCSRKCCDEHKKLLMLGEKNPAYGKKQDNSVVKKRMLKIWQNPNIKEHIKKSLNEFKNKNGYWPGSDAESNKKRKETYLKKYGVDHNWKDKICRDKCDETTKKLYGKSSLELMRDALVNQKETSIEIKFKEILEKYDIKYKQYYKVNYKDSYKEYDFLLVNFNILVEIDGDFWHANPVYYNKENLVEIQKINLINDELKNNLAINLGYSIIRFWETNIKKSDFEVEFLKHFGDKL